MNDEELVFAVKKGRAEPVELWSRFKRLIKRIAFRYSGDQAELLEDLLQESYFAVLDAIKCYDGTIKFKSYLVYWLRQRFSRYIDNCCHPVRVPVYAAQQARSYRRMLSDFATMAGREPTAEEIKTALHCDVDTVKRDLLTLEAVSLDKPLEEGGTLADLVPDEQTDVENQVIDNIASEELRKKLWAIVDTLPEGATIRKRYQQNKTLQQCADELNVSSERVRAIEAKAIKALREQRIAEQLQPYVDSIRYSRGLGRGFDPTPEAAFKAAEYLEKLKTDGLL